MLYSYYDIDIAEDVFGGLYICSNLTPSRSQHLVLLLDLSIVDVSGVLAATRMSFHADQFRPP